MQRLAGFDDLDPWNDKPPYEKATPCAQPGIDGDPWNDMTSPGISTFPTTKSTGAPQSYSTATPSCAVQTRTPATYSSCPPQTPVPQASPAGHRQFLVHLIWRDAPNSLGIQAVVSPDNRLVVQGMKEGVIMQWNERCKNYYPDDQVCTGDEIVGVCGWHINRISASELKLELKNLAKQSCKEILLTIQRQHRL